MGWLYTQGQSRCQLISSCLGGSAAPVGFRALDHAVLRNHLWVVFERMTSGESPSEPVGSDTSSAAKGPERFIALYLLGSHRGYGWGYKAIEEGMGPVEVDCPLRFITLSPVPNGTYSEGWRERVRNCHAERAAKRARVRQLTIGAALDLAPGCQPARVVLTSLKPLRGRADDGRVYRVALRHLPVPPPLA